MQTDFIGELEAKLRRYWAGESSDQIAYIGNIAVKKITAGTFSTGIYSAPRGGVGLSQESLQGMADLQRALETHGIVKGE